MNNEKKKRDGNQTLYIMGEIAGRVAVWATRIAIIAFTSGAACMLTWDVRERKARKKLNNKN